MRRRGNEAKIRNCVCAQLATHNQIYMQGDLSATARFSVSLSISHPGLHTPHRTTAWMFQWRKKSQRLSLTSCPETVDSSFTSLVKIAALKSSVDLRGDCGSNDPG
jgi:hypothetical protein